MSDLRNGRPVAIATHKAKGRVIRHGRSQYLDNHADDGAPHAVGQQGLVSRYIPADFDAAR